MSRFFRVIVEASGPAMFALSLVAGMTLVSFGQEAGGGGAQAPGASPTPQSPSDPANPRWTSLFNGRDLTGWYTFLQKHGKNRDPDRVIAIEDGAIHLYKEAAEGSPVVMGYIATEKEYGDYHLRLQYRWGTKKFQPRFAMKRDAGLYYHILGPDAVWPRSLQFQIQQTDVGDLLALYGFAVDTWIDPKTGERRGSHLPRPEARRPVARSGRTWHRLPETLAGRLRG